MYTPILDYRKFKTLIQNYQESYITINDRLLESLGCYIKFLEGTDYIVIIKTSRKIKSIS